jgi:hypothetical protein
MVSFMPCLLSQHTDQSAYAVKESNRCLAQHSYESKHIFSHLEQAVTIWDYEKFVMMNWYSFVTLDTFLGAFEKFQEAAISFVIFLLPSFRPSISPHGTTPLPLDGFR